MEEWYAVIALGVLGLGLALIVIFRLVSRSASRREQAERPLDPDSAEGLRGAHNDGAAIDAQKDKGYERPMGY